MSEELLNLNLGQAQNSVKIHPLVPLQILELSYRNQGQKVMGSILGIVHSSYIEITNCFAVPQKSEKEEQKQSLDANYHNIMLNHNSTVYPQESLLGAFVSDTPNLENDLINLTNFYGSKDIGFTSQPGLVSPLIISIDTKLKNGTFDIKVLSYDKQLDMCKHCGILPFKNIPVNVEFGDEKLNEVPSFVQQSNSQQVNSSFLSAENIKALLKQLLENLHTIQSKVQDIVDEKVESDENLGKQIKKLLNFVPNMSQQEFAKGLQRTNQDVLLIQFLSNLAKTQSLVTEKLNSISINV